MASSVAALFVFFFGYSPSLPKLNFTSIASTNRRHVGSQTKGPEFEKRNTRHGRENPMRVVDIVPKKNPTGHRAQWLSTYSCRKNQEAHV